MAKGYHTNNPKDMTSAIPHISSVGSFIGLLQPKLGTLITQKIQNICCSQRGESGRLTIHVLMKVSLSDFV